MDIKNTVFLCDMDGTLLRGDSTVSQKIKIPSVSGFKKVGILV